jgi:hypothetical protein
MNTRQSIDESIGPYSLSATFNHDNSCFSVGLDTGFCGKKRLKSAIRIILEEAGSYQGTMEANKQPQQYIMPTLVSSRF